MSGTVILAAAALSDGADIEWISGALAIAHKKGEKFLLSAHRGTETSVAAALVKDKLLSKRILFRAGVSTPRGRAVGNVEDAISFQREIDAPIVLKPRFGNTGRGVSVDLITAEEIGSAFAAAARIGPVIAEEFIDWVSEYRCLASRDECVSVTERLLPTVIGDGVSTVRELIAERNHLRNEVLSTFNRPIPFDSETERTLRGQGYGFEDVLLRDERLIVRNVGGLSSGGEPYERTADVQTDIKALAVAATSAIPGLDWSGPDIVVDRHGRGYVIEINTSAGITGAAFPLYGAPVPIGAAIWQRIKSASHRSPQLPKTLATRRIPTRVRKDEPEAQESLLLDELFQRSLESRGISVTAHSRSLREVDHEGTLWFRGIRTVTDWSSASVVGQRFELARMLMAARGMALPRAKIRMTSGKLRRCKRQSVDEEVKWALVSGRGGWPGREMVEPMSIAEITPGHLAEFRRPLLQEVITGRLYRVVVTPHGPLATLSPVRWPRFDLSLVESLAEQVLDEIPHLSIAVVDVIASNSGEKLIDGVSLNPRIHPDWWVVSGSLRNVWDYLLASPKLTNH